MIWVAWRQFRTQALVTIGLLAAFAALVLVTGLHLHHMYNPRLVAGCLAGGTCPALNGWERALSDALPFTLLAIPGLLGMFWGAPLVARELESGTFRLAWTQSVTRRRWLTVRVALVGIAALAVAGLASWLVSWWMSPVDAVNLDRLDPSVFTARGVVAIGYAALAFALGVASGALIRRTLPAMVATLLGFVAARLAVTFWVRPNLLGAREVLVPVTAGKGVAFVVNGPAAGIAPSAPPIPNAWMISTALVDHAHRIVGPAQLQRLLVRACPTIAAGKVPDGKGSSVALGDVLACQRNLSHHIQQLVTYQPSSHYWPLQALETGIFLAAALALIGLTIRIVGPRAARAAGAAAEAREPVAEPPLLKLAPEVAPAPVRQTGDGEVQTLD